MKLVKLFNLMVLALGCAFALTGCHMGVQNPETIHGLRTNPGDEGLNSGRHVMLPPPNIDSTGGSTDATTFHPPTENGNHTGYAEDATTLKSQTVYFDLDKASFKASEQAKLAEVANFMKSNPAKAIRVEGNCDERGTEEYNRSLGERRALSAREYLINAGIDPQRVDTLTNGEDKPAEVGHSEKFWSKNRRDEFIVLTPPRP